MNMKYTAAKKEVLEASLWLSSHGYFGSLRGSGGNVSVRVDQSSMAITPSSIKYDDLSANDICIVGLDNTPIDVKDDLKPSVETVLHSVIYANRPDVHAVVHTHQIYGSVFSVINTPIPSLFDEVTFALGKTIEVIPYALSGSPELAANVKTKLSNNANAYIIQNHGTLTLGKTLDKAILHAELLEKVSYIYYLALSTGKTVSELPSSVSELAAALRDSEVAKALKKN
ncbi:MAG: class II aldolase/adducin family protein [Smithellaceae bacterium]|jgi:L-ribulose-5-phosphate 4-epimerase|nr:class II aldolase/adducin family protein [Syntrophaceae bacterium]MBP8608727.1 class II aldolase/adducin family protein [Syntrophaceae bacterium]NMD05038.1 class II aldolase/adducin family protein [Deltaproteobacteria bacterium]